ncbi:hypothetical protein E6C60_3048 [Paenibacillus algicola]|uniref:Uncharacterized protein n=1 Tax=Paenibacillus algicola TaxID=2565926 RepID=A0A4P8XSU9_9BACL|nr:hypothetical protein [Paenibacillus algicola]QCT03759.1 hypothetical protein E6C60_3048 [Paenibacillus algicola]
MNNQVKLTDAEKIELSYLHLKGFRYLVRNEIGSVKVFVNKPHRDKETNYAPFGKTRGGYDHWIETKTPVSVEEQLRCRGVELGKYDFIKWADEPMLIEMLIDTPPVPTINPVNNRLEKDVFIRLIDAELSHWNSEDAYARGRAQGLQWVIDRVKSVPPVPTIAAKEEIARLNCDFYALKQLFLKQRKELAVAESLTNKNYLTATIVNMEHELFFNVTGVYGHFDWTGLNEFIKNHQDNNGPHALVQIAAKHPDTEIEFNFELEYVQPEYQYNNADSPPFVLPGYYQPHNISIVQIKPQGPAISLSTNREGK